MHIRRDRTTLRNPEFKSPSDTSTRCSPCSEHVHKFETDLNPHGFPRSAW